MTKKKMPVLTETALQTENRWKVYAAELERYSRGYAFEGDTRVSLATQLDRIEGETYGSANLPIVVGVEVL